MGVNYGYLSSVASGRRPWTPLLRERATAVLGEVPRAGDRLPAGRPRGRGEHLHPGARPRPGHDPEGPGPPGGGVGRLHVGSSAGPEEHEPGGPGARVEEALDAPARVEPAQPHSVDPRALWDRMDAHELSQNETARLAGISSGHLSQIMNGQRNPSGEVLAKLHGVLFRPSAAELVVPAEVKVMAWKKGGRNGVVVRGAGGPGSGSTPGGGTVRIGGRVPWGAEVEYAYRAGYDRRGRVSVTHVVNERGYSVMLNHREPGRRLAQPPTCQQSPPTG